MELRHRVLGLALLCAAGASHGLALGPVSGAAWIGRPLDLVVPVQGAMGEDALSSCFEVEVYHGDSRQEANRVSVTAQVGEQPQVTDVRIASISSVDEPVVTVQVRATCSQKVSRQYVLLADMPREMVAPTVLPDTPAPEPQLARVDPAAIVPAEPGAAGPIPVAAAKAEPTPSAPVARDTGTSAVARPSPVAARKRPAAKTAPTPRRVPTGLARAQAKPAAPKARLVLDSLEMLSDRVASLESATAEALKPDLLTDARKVQTLEADVKALLALAAKNEASLIDLKARLQRAEAERMPNEVVYGLVVLALAALVAWALWSRRQRHTGTWSTVQGRSESAESGPVPLPVPVVRPVTAPSPVEDSAASKAARLQALSAMLDRNGPSSELDVSLIEMSESNFDNLMKSGMPQNAIRVPTPARAARPADAAAPLAHAGLSVDAVFDIRQQAEFFVSLGQTDRAIRVLEGPPMRPTRWSTWICWRSCTCPAARPTSGGFAKTSICCSTPTPPSLRSSRTKAGVWRLTPRFYLPFPRCGRTRRCRR